MVHRLPTSISLLLVLALAACGNDNGNTDAGPLDAGPVACLEPNFTSIHDGLLSKSTCAAAGCHLTVSPTAGNLGFKLGKDQVHAELLMMANETANGTRVVPGNAAMSFFHTKVSSMTAPGVLGRMPPGGPYLQDCDIQAITDWINAGAMND